jgi:AraC-like DNA-binding protein
VKCASLGSAPQRDCMNSALMRKESGSDETSARGLLERWPSIKTSSPEGVRGFLFGREEPSRLKAAAPGGSFAQINCVELSQIGLGFQYVASEMETDMPPIGCFSQFFCLDGRGESFIGEAAIPITEDHSSVVGPHVETRMRFDAGFRGLTLHVARDTLARKLEALLGFRPEEDNIEFSPRVSLVDPLARHLQHSTLFLAQELDASDAPSPDMAFKEFEEYLILLFLRANRHTFSDLLHAPERGNNAPWQVKLAEDYLEANWAKSVTIEDIAAKAGVSARSIFKAFRQSRGYSPMSFLKELRLKKAREMLQRAEHEASVAGIARRCGFLSLGHFARDYEKRFGERPSITLRGARGRR